MRDATSFSLLFRSNFVVSNEAMIRTNKEKLVRIAVEGTVAPAMSWINEVGRDGIVRSLPGVGGITYNVLLGDSAYGWAADHIEPAVSSILNAEKRDKKPNMTYNFLACIGNEVTVLAGQAKGAKGIVTGRHGGMEHVMLDFPRATLEKLSLEDRFQIRTFGQGLELIDYPEILVSSLDPRLLEKMKLKGLKRGLEVPVAGIVPGKLMGSGIGELQSRSGDYDIQTADANLTKKHGIDKLKLGDIVAITDHDASFGWRYLEGAVVIGVVIHGDSFCAGHGPGVSTIMSSATGKIIPRIDPKANIGRYLKIGRFRGR